jgi:hypothetical protein
MIFLQPFILYGLPLVLLPVLIHLLNRLRYRTQQWAAMRFLLSARKQSIRRSRLRQWLILLMRMLALLAIILFLARPMTGGWASLFSSGEPEIILLALDRSASMEARLPNGKTRREQALENFEKAAAARENARVVLVESVYRDPQPLAKAADLRDPFMERYVGPTDTSSDVPALLTSALDWLEENEVGSAEIWIASDCQASDWVPDGSEPRWERLSKRLAEVDEKFALRLLHHDADTKENLYLRCEKVTRRQNLLGCSMKLGRDKTTGGSLFLEVLMDDETSEVGCSFEGTLFRWEPEFQVDPDKREGWGKLRLPKDGNSGDNEAYFVYGSPQNAKAIVIAENPEVRRSLAKASVNLASGKSGQAEAKSLIELNPGDLDSFSLLFWQGPLPDESTAAVINDFIEKGGIAMFFPPENHDDGIFAKCSWEKKESSEKDSAPFKLSSWEKKDGPLANTEEGDLLPLAEIHVKQRRSLQGETRQLAFFADGPALLSRIAQGKGEILFLNTLPLEGWSDFYDGYTLVPMAQRLLKQGAGRFNPPASLPCGTPGLAPPGTNWTCVDAPKRKDPHSRAGIYRIDGRLVALNRPDSEDDSSVLELSQCKAMLGEKSLSSSGGSGNENSEVPAEIWRNFLFLTLAALVVEAILVIPSREDAASAITQKQGKKA